MHKSGVIMDIVVHFRYQEEVWSLYNKTFNIGTIVFLLMCFIGYVASDTPNSKYVFVVLGIIYMFFVVKTIRIWMKRKNIMRYGSKCRGSIINMIVEEGSVSDMVDADFMSRSYELVTLLVEYVDPNTGETKQFETSEVNGNPFFYLSSLVVTVYIQPDGNAWATDFQGLRSLKDSWLRNNKEMAKNIKPIYRRR